jgi:hypothetical protein
MWDKTRLTIYLTAAATGLGLLLTALGAADFDRATGMIDLHPFNAYALAGLVAGPVASLLASVAVLFKWGRK